jgi:predicted ABC-type ATPase
MDLGLNVVVDGTGDSKKGKFAGKMKDMDGAGYDVSALYVTIPTDEAVVRATKRAMKSGRWVPEPELRSQHKNVSANFEDVAALPFCPKDLKLYDNSGDGDPGARG